MHFITRCKQCNTIMDQCRCMSKDKIVKWGLCSKCTTSIALKNIEKGMTYMCCECNNNFPKEFIIYLSSGKFICPNCMGIESLARQQAGLPQLELGVIGKRK